jgi:predicted RNA methylase
MKPGFNCVAGICLYVRSGSGREHWRGSSVIDLGCGPGFPITAALVEEGLQVFGVDAAPSFVAAFQRNLAGAPIICESVVESRLFDRTFDALVASGLIFLLSVTISIA